MFFPLGSCTFVSISRFHCPQRAAAGRRKKHRTSCGGSGWVRGGGKRRESGVAVGLNEDAPEVLSEKYRVLSSQTREVRQMRRDNEP